MHASWDRFLPAAFCRIECTFLGNATAHFIHMYLNMSHLFLLSRSSPSGQSCFLYQKDGKNPSGPTEAQPDPPPCAFCTARTSHPWPPSALRVKDTEELIQGWGQGSDHILPWVIPKRDSLAGTQDSTSLHISSGMCWETYYLILVFTGGIALL